MAKPNFDSLLAAASPPPSADPPPKRDYREVAGMLDPGLHFDVPFRRYTRLPALNGGTLEWGMMSQRALKQAMDGGLQKGDTAALGFGRTVHTLVFEPHLFDETYAIGEQCAATTAGMNQCSRGGTTRHGGVWYCNQHATGTADDIERVTREEASRAKKLAAAIREHEPSRKLLEIKSGCEVTVTADLMGHPFKGRFDKLIQTPGDKPDLILDLKTIRGVANVSRDWDVRRTTDRAIMDYGYFRKAALYVDLYRAATGRDANFAWLFAMSEPPYEVAVRFAGQWLVVGRDGRYGYEQVLKGFLEAREKNTYEFAIPKAETCEVPDWIFKTMDEDQ